MFGSVRIQSKKNPHLNPIEIIDGNDPSNETKHLHHVKDLDPFLDKNHDFFDWMFGSIAKNPKKSTSESDHMIFDPFFFKKKL